MDPALDHILTLLGFSLDTHPVRLALGGGSYTTLISLFSLTRSDLETLTYRDPNNPDILEYLPRGIQVALLVPQGYRLYFKQHDFCRLDCYHC
jgi:hypothetical protein